MMPTVKRVRHTMFNALVAVSALLCVATIAMWVRSDWSMDQWSFKRSRIGDQYLIDQSWSLRTGSGLLRLQYWFEKTINIRPDLFDSFAKNLSSEHRFKHSSTAPDRSLMGATNDDNAWNEWGFYASFSHPNYHTRVCDLIRTNKIVVFPIWLLSAVSMIPSLVWIRRRRRHRQNAPAFPVVTKQPISGDATALEHDQDSALQYQVSKPRSPWQSASGLSMRIGIAVAITSVCVAATFLLPSGTFTHEPVILQLALEDRMVLIIPPLAIVGIVLGIIARSNERTTAATLGIVLSLTGLVISAVMSAIVLLPWLSF